MGREVLRVGKLLVYILHALNALALGLRASPLCQFYKRHG